MTRSLVTVVLLSLLTVAALADKAPPRELGMVRWLRDFDAAVAAAVKAERPILLLFQEVPG